ncbi:MAG: AAA family ATPase [Neisseriales bacterium]|nr:MAG: AAA family ATPase [Neisseriales bacterium]
MSSITIDEILKSMGDDGSNSDSATDKLKNNIPLDIQQKITKVEEILEENSDDIKAKTLLHTLENLPYDKFIPYNVDIKAIQEYLNKSHYGMDKAKSAIIETLVASKYRGDVKFPYVCLYGSPGVGKTSLFKSIAESLGVPFHVISLPGVDAFRLKGIDSGYKSASYGLLVDIFLKSKCMNPIIVFDELDKVAKDETYSAITSILLSICDPTQNTSFVDSFLEVGIDISHATLFFTANDINAIPEALRSRLTIIKIDDYSVEEKIRIGKDYIIPKQLNEFNVASKINITQEAIDFIAEAGSIDDITITACGGIREISKLCERTLYKAIYELEINHLDQLVITKDWIVDKLGIHKIEEIKSSIKARTSYRVKHLFRIGTVHALAVGKSVLGEDIGIVDDVTCRIISGNGELKFTGNMRDEPRDAATIAYDFVRSNSKKFFGKAGDILENKDVIIHSHDPGIVKDGTSAGVVYLIAILSAALGIPIPDDVAMTGQLDLDGSVTGVGGISVKVGACIKSKLSRVYLSYQNMKDVSKEQREIIEIIIVENAFELISSVFPDIVWHCDDCGSILEKKTDTISWLHQEQNKCINYSVYEGDTYPILAYEKRRQ